MARPLVESLTLRSRLPDFLSRRADLLFIVGLTLLAAVPRLYQLDAIPQGVHGDEAQYGMDAQRVLSDGWIGVYTRSALGQPAGIAYVAAPGQWLFGATALGARFSVALFAIAAVPLAYVLFRLLSTRAVAVIAACLLATSLWHVQFSRVAYQPALVPTIELATLVFWVLGMQRDRWYWFVAAGATLGLGMYTYNVYPMFVIAFTLWVALYTVLFRRRDFIPWAQNVMLAAAAALLVAFPLLLFMADGKNEYFKHYRQYYDTYSVLRSKEYRAAGSSGKVDIVWDQATKFVGAYAWHGVIDYVDGSSPDGRPMLDRPTLLLFLAGTGIALWRWRRTPHLLALMLVAIIPLTSVLQTNSTYRGPLGAAPFLLFLAALPLGLVWDRAQSMTRAWRQAAMGIVAGIVLTICYLNLHAYFGNWAHSYLFPWVYTQQMSAASEYMKDHADGAYVYFLSNRWTFHYETRRYLAPDVEGEDRSKEFGRTQSLEINRLRAGLFVLLPPYLERLPELQKLYPEGQTFVGRDGDETLFIAYRVPALLPTASTPH